MSKVCRFPPMKVKKFLHKCQPRGRLVVKNVQNLLNVVYERPLGEALCAKIKIVDPSLTLQKKLSFFIPVGKAVGFQ